ncbi:class E sortase [Streptomyces sp. ID05-04B]|uniref:class E sortase n=1 Tax=unclassified Streptomyces TaxID=2593676 RepID=UPI000D19BD42|nr:MULTISPECIES: class E sortase [unclassified Streptomyces]AVV47112.1 class E sortase [Streptomyces sp. P3]MDX5566605.1 class E sortase [Streptomyces sp. ID05-04B]
MRNALRLLGIGLILAGMTLGGFKVFQDWRSDHAYMHAQQALREEFQKSAAHPKAAPEKKPAAHEGQALAVLRIPRFGPQYAPVVVQGVSQASLRKGPGHFPGTAMPGETGNFALAGHRTGWGQPFNRLPELRKGDAVTVERQGKSATYRVTRTKVVKPTDVGVVLPVPDRPAAEPDKARITLTTCTDRGPDGTYVHRFVVWGELAER